MTDKVQYSIVNTEDGNISVQSTVKSFNLDHVTDKDIVSFYTNFSQYAAWDTGLLPVEGSGILSIRTAGSYTQFAYQHKPGLYHVNWSSTEGSAATAYYLAQPYRIIICDMVDGNLLGARTFYSPYPITSPSQPLYHVNLPNINCKGYRGNGVGWICLYQNEDWSSLPLNERIVRFIERCSGVETYNDGNMSETDGPRFYQQHHKPDYVTDPLVWQEKSSNEGYEWTLDETLWIPVLVESMDSQTAHKEHGVPLTFADAIVGDYQAYYYDTQLTKPINAVIRPDKTLNSKEVLSFFVKSYNGATKDNNSLLNDTFNNTLKVKDSKGSVQFFHSSLLDSPENHSESNEDVPFFVCSYCEEPSDDEPSGVDYESKTAICYHCAENEYVYFDKLNAYVKTESDRIVYDFKSDTWLHRDHDYVIDCKNCGTCFGTPSDKDSDMQLITSYFYGNPRYACIDCIDSYIHENDLTSTNCFSCNKLCLDNQDDIYFPKVNIIAPEYNFDEEKIVYNNKNVTLCSTCATNHVVCPCGYLKDSSNAVMNQCTKTKMAILGHGDYYDYDYYDYSVTKCCDTCLSPAKVVDDTLIANYTPVNSEVHTNFIISIKDIKIKSHLIEGLTFHNDEEPF
jgi:hypothetical protein